MVTSLGMVADISPVKGAESKTREAYSPVSSFFPSHVATDVDEDRVLLSEGSKKHRKLGRKTFISHTYTSMGSLVIESLK